MAINKDIKNAAIWGVYTGLIYSALTLGLYFISPQVYANWMFRPIPLFIVLILMAYVTNQRYISEEQDVPFKLLVQSSFIVFVLAELFWRVTDYSLHNLIDPELGEVVRQVTIDEYKKLMHRGGSDNMNIEMMQKQMSVSDYSVTLQQSVKGFVNWLFFGFIFSFLISLVVRFKHTIKFK